MANLSPAPRSCRIAGLPAGSVAVRRLDEESFPEPAAESLDGADHVDLAPFAYLRIDVSQ